ncbi:MAG: DUF4112 domain-containing protein [Gemmatimonadales bacterium]
MTTATDSGRRLVERIDRIALVWDEAFRLPVLGWRVGWDAVVGLIPGVGDLIGVAVAGYLVSLAARLGAPTTVLARMLLNVAVDAAGGLVPVLGDLFDAGWKANRRNRRLLMEWLAEPARVAARSRAALGAVLAGAGLMLGLTGWLLVAMFRAVFG